MYVLFFIESPFIRQRAYNRIDTRRNVASLLRISIILTIVLFFVFQSASRTDACSISYPDTTPV